ncbi:histidine kinase [Chitinophaga pendula]|uniref:sensor histidine kinase n=1 Tax=Chitinophaga TaxID=79328 RepID=UPI000BAE8BDE|nr:MULTISPECIES: histidine kinase [Chitinophaga]ASZ11855.1 histidine kinase [Chitinophaga sp. MD30]UCJ05120.1 histidine kinase [Chitinophaga pendula]
MNKVRKTELAVVTAIYLLLLFPLLYTSVSRNVFELQDMYGHKFARYHQVFDYYIHYLLPSLARMTILYLALLCIHFVIVPRYLEQRRWWIGIPLAIITMALVFVTLMVAGSYYNGYLLGVYDTVQGAHTHFAKSAFILTIFCAVLYIIYYILREVYWRYGHEWISRTGFSKQLSSELGIALALWILFIVLAVSSDSHTIMRLIFMAGPVFIGLLFVWSYIVLPQFQQHGDKNKLIRDILLTTAATCVLLALVLTVIGWYGRKGFLMAGLMGGLALLIILPLSWWLYRIRRSQQATVSGLQIALGTSAATLDFHRSQINPHFLFNALNTLYGTALQEKASLTSEGIQRLGDMMRFMLHDNHQEKIPLEKEVAYLRNYIALQTLRTQAAPNIVIEVNIEEKDWDLWIVPMLLIPFVENAFKHGISMRYRSRIVVSLSCTQKHIFFDVYNTVHERPENDPERENLGIGLNNVKQRLNLLYPGKHELTIRHTATEFFVHLTIDTE